MRRRKTFLFAFLILSLLLAACVHGGGTEGENSYTIYYPAAELRDVPGEDAIVARTVQLPDADTLTQEELAQQLNVSRQSVSKWEGAQSVPDLDKIVQLSGFLLTRRMRASARRCRAGQRF